MAKNNIKKNAAGYGYKYTDLAEIHNHLEENNMTYYQYIEPVDGVDYIWTVPIIEGKEQTPKRGCRIIEAKLSGKDNPVQAYGASLTYCRRYSLLMAFGLATTDDDAACLTVTERPKAKQNNKAALINRVQDLCKSKNLNVADFCKQVNVNSLSDMYVGQLEELINFLEG